MLELAHLSNFSGRAPTNVPNLLASPVAGRSVGSHKTLPQSLLHGYGRPRPLRAKTVAAISLPMLPSSFR